MAQNDFLQFDENNENVLTQDAYREDEQRISGAKSGVARSSLFNKVLRQVSTFVAGFGQFISEKNINILEDIDSVKNALTNLFTAKNIGVSTEVQELLGADNVDDGLKNSSSFINSSYLGFIYNINSDSLDACFGKNNEEYILNIGKQLWMYANFKGVPLSVSDLEILTNKNKLHDVFSEAEISNKICQNSELNSLISNSPFALEVHENVNKNLEIPDLVLFEDGVSEFLDLSSFSYTGGSGSVSDTIHLSVQAKSTTTSMSAFINFKNTLEEYPFINYSYIVFEGTFTLSSYSSAVKYGFYLKSPEKTLELEKSTSGSSTDYIFKGKGKNFMFSVNSVTSLDIYLSSQTQTGAGYKTSDLSITKIYLTNNPPE